MNEKSYLPHPYVCRIGDSKSEKTIEYINQAVWHDYKNILRRVLFEKAQHAGDCGLTGRFADNRTSLPLKGN
jgi:hypothetical protein